MEHISLNLDLSPNFVIVLIYSPNLLTIAAFSELAVVLAVRVVGGKAPSVLLQIIHLIPINVLPHLSRFCKGGYVGQTRRRALARSHARARTRGGEVLQGMGEGSGLIVFSCDYNTWQALPCLFACLLPYKWISKPCSICASLL